MVGPSVNRSMGRNTLRNTNVSDIHGSPGMMPQQGSPNMLPAPGPGLNKSVNRKNTNASMVGGSPGVLPSKKDAPKSVEVIRELGPLNPPEA